MSSLLLLTTLPHPSHFLPDIDECALQADNHLCAYHCSNTNGSFMCTCPPTGYTLSADGQSCQGQLGAFACKKDFECKKQSPLTNRLLTPRRYQRVPHWEPQLHRPWELLQHPGRVPLPLLQMSSLLPGNRKGVRRTLEKLLLCLCVTMCGFSLGAPSSTHSPKTRM